MPDIKQCNTAAIWWETKGGKIKVPTPGELMNMKFPSPKKYPFCATRFPLTVMTEYYRRRKDGGYGKDDLILRGGNSANEELVIKLVINSRFKMHLREALIVVSQACERCMNILAWKNGCSFGYSPRSKAARVCKTSCQLCR